MQGIFIRGRRPDSKKQVREAVRDNPETVELEATSLFGNEYGGPITEAPAGRYDFVGPDPYTKRNFYGNITVGQGTGAMTHYSAHAVRTEGEPEVLVHQHTGPDGDPGDPIARTPWDVEGETAIDALARLGYQPVDWRSLDPWTPTSYGAVTEVEPGALDGGERDRVRREATTDLDEAQRQIDRLKDERDRLREALEEADNLASEADRGDMSVYLGGAIDDYKRVRAALDGGGS